MVYIVAEGRANWADLSGAFISKPVPLSVMFLSACKVVLSAEPRKLVPLWLMFQAPALSE